jgi:hypothetical protein
MGSVLIWGFIYKATVTAQKKFHGFFGFAGSEARTTLSFDAARFIRFIPLPSATALMMS